MKVEHNWEEEILDHDCSYVECWCEHTYCTECGVEKDTIEADGSCPGHHPSGDQMLNLYMDDEEDS